ncbi:MAG: lipoate--protein ligase family protein [Prevotella sp.]|nr:lipoate--protein ligase family protein [Prevotella sp.]
MTYIDLPNEEPHQLSFYLAMEEYIAMNKEISEAFFMWQVDPSVIFGRNQDVYAEVNLDYCREHGIHTFRRKSGGGCVYADQSNVMMSYITDSDEVQSTFTHYMEMMTNTLRQMGVNASWTEHNDIMIGDRKVSGNAFYHLHSRAIVHGTMLYDTNMENMIGSITPSDAKLVKHGVESVRQRITLLKNHISLSLNEMKTFVRSHLCTSAFKLTAMDVDAIRNIEQHYLSHNWIFGHQPRH